MASSYLLAKFRKGEPGATQKSSYESIARIISAVNHREKIIVYGKGNREGICSIAILILVLRYFNADFDYFLIPPKGNRETLISDVKTHLNFYSPGIILSLDENFTESIMDTLREVNTELISVDWWENQSEKNLTPLIKNVFLFARELSTNYDTDNINRYIDLVYLGADEREMGQDKLMTQGYERLKVSTNYGINALKKHRGLGSDDLRSMIKPKDNPWSMVDNARIIIELLTTEDINRAEQIAKYLVNC